MPGQGWKQSPHLGDEGDGDEECRQCSCTSQGIVSQRAGYDASPARANCKDCCLAFSGSSPGLISCLLTQGLSTSLQQQLKVSTASDERRNPTPSPLWATPHHPGNVTRSTRHAMMARMTVLLAARTSLEWPYAEEVLWASHVST